MTPAPFTIEDQRLAPDGYATVTVALTGLRRVTLRLQATSWMEGEHLRAIDALPSLLDAIAPAINTDRAELVGNDRD